MENKVSGKVSVTKILILVLIVALLAVSLVRILVEVDCKNAKKQTPFLIITQAPSFPI